jgi:23S rRNA pseudouridine1911/1915/1917 synthase
MLNGGFDYRETIGQESAGRSVLEHLARRYRHSSPEEWRERILGGRVLLDGEPAAADGRLRAGQLLVWRRPPWVEPEAPLGWALVHRDREVLGVVKPPGLPTLPGGGFLEHSLLFQVRQRFPDAAPVHRLDRGASGVVLFARTALARGRMAEAFREERVEKEYLARVQGSPRWEETEIAAPIGRAAGRLFVAVPEEMPARAARTRVHVLRRDVKETLLAVRPLTGRPHQIRIHLAFAGHPLVGEPVYGLGGHPLPRAARPGAGGYFLHALRLRFEHPESGKVVEITSPLSGTLLVGC